jgi:hypothetical protein
MELVPLFADDFAPLSAANAGAAESAPITAAARRLRLNSIDFMRFLLCGSRGWGSARRGQKAGSGERCSAQQLGLHAMGRVAKGVQELARAYARVAGIPQAWLLPRHARSAHSRIHPHPSG